MHNLWQDNYSVLLFHRFGICCYLPKLETTQINTSHFLHIHIFLLFSRSVMSDSFVTTWTVAPQAPLSMGFPRQEYWSGLPFPPPRASFKTLACSGSDKVLLNMTMISFQVKSKAKGMCWNVSIYLPGLV